MTDPTVTLYLNRSTGRWHANIYWPDSHTRYRPSLGVPADADPTEAFGAFKRDALPGIIEERHLRAEAEQEIETAKQRRSAGPRIADLSDWYLNVHAPYVGIKPKTLTKYRQILRDFELFCRARKLSRIDQVNMARVQEFVGWLESETGPKAPKTRHNTIGCLRSWLNAAVDAGKLDAGPVRKWILPRLPEPEPHAMTRQQLEAVLASVERYDPAIYPVILLMAWTGLRPSDAARLQWRHVRSQHLELRQQKTGRAWRIPLGPQTRQALELAGQPGAGNAFVFQAESGRPWPDRTLLRRFQAACAAGNIGHAVTLKLLRTTFATMLARAGCNPRLHQLLLGHSKLETTLRYYTEVDDAMAADFMARFTTENP